MYLSVKQAMETTEKIQDELFMSIQQRNVDRVKAILCDHPELVNMERIRDFHLGTSTPLMEACFWGEFTTSMLHGFPIKKHFTRLKKLKGACT